MSLRLSSEFRRWSRWYPASWRADSGAAMLGTYLDLADADGRDRLTAADKAALVAGGFAARLELVVPSRVRDSVATVMVSLLGAYALVTGVVMEWAPWGAAQRTQFLHQIFQSTQTTQPLSFGLFLSPYVIVAGAAVIAWLLCMSGPTWLYRVALVVTILIAMLIAIAAHFGVGHFVWLRGFPALFAAGVALLVLPGARPRPWRMLGGTGLWLLAFYVSGQFLSANDWIRDAVGRVPTAFFFEGTVTDFTSAWYGTALALLAALVLLIARRPAIAAVVVIATLPWAAVIVETLPHAAVASWIQLQPYLPFIGILALGYFAAVGATIACSIRSRRSAGGSSGETPSNATTGPW